MFFGLLDKGLLLEGVDSNDIIDAIKNHHIVSIVYKGKIPKKYGGEESEYGKGERTIYPFVYGKTTAGNYAIRAYQPSVDSGKMPAPNEYTFSGHHPAWRLFLVKNIVSWRDHVTNDDYEKLTGKKRPERYTISAGTYKEVEGHYNAITDRQMSQIIAQAEIPGLEIKGRNWKGDSDIKKYTFNKRKQGMKDIVTWFKEYRNNGGKNNFDEIKAAYQEYVDKQINLEDENLKRLSEILKEYEDNGWKGDLLAFIRQGGNKEMKLEKSGVVTKSGAIDDGNGNDTNLDNEKAAQATKVMADAQNSSANNTIPGPRGKSGNVMKPKKPKRDKYAKYSNIKSLKDLVKGVTYPAGFVARLMEKEAAEEAAKNKGTQYYSQTGYDTNVNTYNRQSNNTQSPGNPQQQQPNTYQPQNTQIRNRRNKH